MPRKKKETSRMTDSNMPPAAIVDQPITDTIETNYMPYVMTVIVSRAIPEIDGFKPSHRKLLYTMYKMGLLTGPRTKSANVVGQTMRLNPHGDSSIYETMVRLTRGNEALLHPFVDSKGSFGKQYSRDMAYAASRYTEVKLDPFCAEIFSGIDKNAVDFVPNYDNTMPEPTLLPTTFPNILLSPNIGIAVGMASNICSFNLAELCDGTIALIKNPKITADKMLDYIKAPDFSGGAYLLYDREQLLKIYETGAGSFRLRAKYQYDRDNNCIEITQIPYCTSSEAIIKKITDMLKEGKLREITDIRDEIDLNGFKITLDLRRGTEPDSLMAKLFRQTTLEDDFSCNFNILVNNAPVTLGVVDILREWITFRLGCIKRELTFDLAKKRDKLHLLRALGKILLDIDKAIKIVRETEKEADVVSRLMDGFGIDEIQAEYIAEIKLRHLNREYIIERIHEIEDLQKAILDLEETIGDELKMKSLIASQLTEIKKKYGKPRKTVILSASEITEIEEPDTVENYNVRIILTREGYFKKITHQSLRGNDEQRLKDGDEIICSEDTENRMDIIVFSDKARAYRAKIDDFDTTKASALGDFLPSVLGFEENERPIMMKALDSYVPSHNAVFIFENGKGVRIPMSAYETKGNRKRLTGAFSSASPVVAAFYETEPFDIFILNNMDRGILLKSSLIPVKTTRTASGVILFTQKRNQQVVRAVAGDMINRYANAGKCRKIKIPATGVSAAADIDEMQLKITD